MAVSFVARGQSPSANTFQKAFEAIKARPEYRHSFFGAEVYSLDQHKVLYAWNGDRLFVPGSTTKLLTAGSAMHWLGTDYRFHTPVYRTGPVDSQGTLQGDLVLVASGDPTLSGRLQKDGTLAFANEDHSYGGSDARLVGDPLAALEAIADQIAASGIRRVNGRVLIDASLFSENFSEDSSEKETKSSPIVVNDNIIDCLIAPGTTAGNPAVLTCTPEVPYIQFVNHVVTGPDGSRSHSSRSVEEGPNGTSTVTISGSIARDGKVTVEPYTVRKPSRFAATLLTGVLEKKGIVVEKKDDLTTVGVKQWKTSYKPENRVAEYVSPPLMEEIKVMLKVSQNLHAHNFPFIVGAVAGKDSKRPYEKGFALEREFLEKAGLDLSGAVQEDGAGAGAFFTPDFMVHYLAYMTTQPDFAGFKAALPILGHDGSLALVQQDSPAAGKVFAKTGTIGMRDQLHDGTMIVGKGLAGYTTLPSGEKVAFALYVNHVPLTKGIGKVTDHAGETLGEISSAIHLFPIAPSAAGGEE